MNPCIGIISYLPPRIYDRRLAKVFNLVSQCNKHFKLPIIIIGQSWEKRDIKKITSMGVTFYSYKEPLGITTARKELQRIFIESEYDHLIMLDDDIMLIGPDEAFKKYIEQLKNNPGKYGLFKLLTLQLYSIPKEIYSSITYPNYEPTKGEFFEDMWLITTVEKLFPQQKFIYVRNGMDAKGNPVNDIDSTWFHGQFNKKKMSEFTRKLIS